MEEVRGGSGRTLGNMRAFRELVLKMGLGDIGLARREFMWCNMREGHMYI